MKKKFLYIFRRTKRILDSIFGDLSDEVFGDLTEIIVDIGNKYCDGRVLSILEGGYNIAGNSSATIKHINALKKKKFNVYSFRLNC